MRILIIGRGGHARVVADAAESASHHVVGFSEVSASELGTAFLNASADAAIIAIGFNPLRASLMQAADMAEVPLATVVHRHACVAGDVEMGRNVMVMAGAVINPGCRLADGVIVNTGASVDHDCTLGHCSAVAPGATLGGNVTLDSFAWVGLGASVIQGRTIGSHTVIGAGSTVLSNIESDVVAIGTPCRVLRRRGHEDRYLG